MISHSLPIRLIKRFSAPLAFLLAAGVLLGIIGAYQSALLPIEGTVELYDSVKRFEITGNLSTYVEDATSMEAKDIPLVLGQLKPASMSAKFPFSSTSSVWIAFKVHNNGSAEWYMDVPLVYLDDLTLFQKDEHGVWTEQHAGDHIPVSSYTIPSTHPTFRLIQKKGETSTVLLRVRHFQALTIPIRFSQSTEQFLHTNQEYALIMLVLGVMATFASISIVRAIHYKHKADWLAFMYSGSLLVIIAQFNGILNLHLWQNNVFMADLGSKFFPTISVSIGVLFVCELLRLTTRHSMFHDFLKIFGYTTLLSNASFFLLPVEQAYPIVYAMMLAAIFATTLAMIGSWVLLSTERVLLTLALTPQVIAALHLLAQQLGAIPVIWNIRLFNSVAIAWAIPILAMIITRVTRGQDESQQRAFNLATQDPLTGLLQKSAFLNELTDRLEQDEKRKDYSLVVTHIVNYDLIRQNFGQPTAEQAVFVSGLKILKILRNSEPAARLNENVFAFVLEGTFTEDDISSRVVHLISQGLMPTASFKTNVPIKYHAVCTLLYKLHADPELMIDTLLHQLQLIRPTSKRPIRFHKFGDIPLTMPDQSIQQAAESQKEKSQSKSES